MLRIAVCDDDILFTGMVEELLRKEALYAAVEIEIDVFFDGAMLEKYICQGNMFDLIYLDIEMAQENGIETARHIRETDKSVLLIYISGYEQYLKELFEVEPFRFLSKPLETERFSRYFHEACQRIWENNAYYQFSFNKEIRKVVLKDIVYFESRNRKIHIFLNNGEEEFFYGKLNEVEKKLNGKKQRYLRIHQSYLVNYDYVQKMNFSSLIVEHNGKKTTLQISEDRQKKIRMQLCQLASGNMGIK
ncbi:LytTR family DNA-binding domain-containing protein [Lachnospiraceae bacterium 54-53]